MTVAVQTPFNSYSANGITTVFAFSFLILQSSDLVVQVSDADGNTTTKIIGVDYTVSGVGAGSGGTVTFLTAPASGLTVKVFRSSQLYRSTDYQDNGDLLAATLNIDFDRIWLALQELIAGNQLAGNVLHTPSGESLNVLPPAVDRKDRMLGFDVGTGQPETSTFTMTQVAAVVAAAYAAAAGPLDALSFLQAGTGARSRSAQAKAREMVSVMDFGAIGDGTFHQLSERYATLAEAQVDYPFVTALTQSIDWAAFQAALNSFGPVDGSDPNKGFIGGTIRVPYGNYCLSDTWKIYKRVRIIGDGSGTGAIAQSSSVLQFALNTEGITCYSSITGPNNKGDAYWARIESLNLSAPGVAGVPSGTIGCGIHAKGVPIQVENCCITLFGSHGIWIDGITGGGSPTGVADSWAVSHCILSNNGGDGLHVAGNDSQVGTCQTCVANSNQGWSYYDNAVYGNAYISCESAHSVAGSFYSLNSTYKGCTYINCYVEGGSGSNMSLDSNALWIGGNAPTMSGTTIGNQFKVGPNGINLNTQDYVTVNYRGTNMVQFQGAANQVAFLPGINLVIGYAGTDSITTSVQRGFFHVSSIATSATMSKYTNPNGQVGSITINGTSTTYATTSDYRLKENVLDMLAPNAVAQIMALRPVTYTWKSTGEAGSGFIAHELQAVFPEAVTGEKDGTEVQEVKDADGNVTGTQTVPSYQGVDVSFIVPSLVAAFQELKNEFDAYKAAHP